MKELHLLIEKARAEHSHAKGWSIHELNNNALRIMYYPYGIRMNGISLAFSCTLTEPNAIEEACRFIEDRLNKEVSPQLTNKAMDLWEKLSATEIEALFPADSSFFSAGSKYPSKNPGHANI